ncbi:MAG: potassium channel family protein [Solirubrobacterales bacterium]
MEAASRTRTRSTGRILPEWPGTGIRHHGKSRARFGLLLIILLVAAVFQLVAPQQDWALFVITILLAAALLVSLEAARVSVQVRQVVIGATIVIVVASGVTLLGIDSVRAAVPRALALIPVILIPVAVVYGLAYQLTEDRTVTVQTVFGVVSIYLLVAFGFSLTYGVLDSIGDPFFADGRSGTTSNFLYYSLATLTTTGYGDFVAATRWGRAFSVTEALMGQIYLVTVVALVVANFGRRRRVEAE